MSVVVTKRTTCTEPFNSNKLLARINKSCYGLDLSIVRPDLITQNVAKRAWNKITTAQVDQLAVEYALKAHAALKDSTGRDDNGYDVLACRLGVSSLHRRTVKKFSECMDILYLSLQPGISRGIMDDVNAFKDVLNSEIVHDRDNAITWDEFHDLMNTKLFRINGVVVWRDRNAISCVWQ
ncbi:UNVERIFIED_CONTAM: hypothetical protein HDU68_011299 [Siphonaria sp. JEL0065]|nr:hypothetical protein HDU68_011299 [Siphonaria sp. JEL0065]